MDGITLETFDLKAALVGMLSREWRIEADKIDCDRPLTEYGLDSITALTISGELEDLLGVELPSTLLWDCPTITGIAGFLHRMRNIEPAASEVGAGAGQGAPYSFEPCLVAE